LIVSCTGWRADQAGLYSATVTEAAVTNNRASNTAGTERRGKRRPARR
jgi:hypothetical protein